MRVTDIFRISPITVAANKVNEKGFDTKIFSGTNLKLTVHLCMKTLPNSKDFVRYCTGKVTKKGRPNTSCVPAQIDRQTNVSQ